jgi:hypothetical protein
MPEQDATKESVGAGARKIGGREHDGRQVGRAWIETADVMTMASRVKDMGAQELTQAPWERAARTPLDEEEPKVEDDAARGTSALSGERGRSTEKQRRPRIDDQSATR